MSDRVELESTTSLLPAHRRYPQQFDLFKNVCYEHLVRHARFQSAEIAFDTEVGHREEKSPVMTYLANVSNKADIARIVISQLFFMAIAAFLVERGISYGEDKVKNSPNAGFPYLYYLGFPFAASIILLTATLCNANSTRKLLQKKEDIKTLYDFFANTKGDNAEETLPANGSYGAA